MNTNITIFLKPQQKKSVLTGEEYNSCNYNVTLNQDQCLEQSLVDVYGQTFCGIESGFGKGFVEIGNPTACMANFVNDYDCTALGSYVTKDSKCYLTSSLSQSSCLPSNPCGNNTSTMQFCANAFCYSNTISTAANCSYYWSSTIQKCIIQLDPLDFDYQNYTQYCASVQMSLWEGRTWREASQYFGTCNSNITTTINEEACVKFMGTNAYPQYIADDLSQCNTVSCSQSCSRCVPQTGYDNNDPNDGKCIKITNNTLECSNNTILYSLMNSSVTLVVCLFENVTETQCASKGLIWFSCRGSVVDRQSEFDNCPGVQNNDASIVTKAIITTGATIIDRIIASEYFGCYWDRGLSCRSDAECEAQGLCTDNSKPSPFTIYNGYSPDYGACIVPKNSLSFMNLTGDHSCEDSPSLMANGLTMMSYDPINNFGSNYCTDLYTSKAICESSASEGEWKYPHQSEKSCEEDTNLIGCGGVYITGRKYSNLFDESNCNTCEEYAPFYEWIPLMTWNQGLIKNGGQWNIMNVTKLNRAFINNNMWKSVDNPADENRILFRGLSQAAVMYIQDRIYSFYVDSNGMQLITIVESYCNCQSDKIQNNNTYDTLCKGIDGILSAFYS